MSPTWRGEPVSSGCIMLAAVNLLPTKLQYPCRHTRAWKNRSVCRDHPAIRCQPSHSMEYNNQKPARPFLALRALYPHSRQQQASCQRHGLQPSRTWPADPSVLKPHPQRRAHHRESWLGTAHLTRQTCCLSDASKMLSRSLSGTCRKLSEWDLHSRFCSYVQPRQEAAGTEPEHDLSNVC